MPAPVVVISAMPARMRSTVASGSGSLYLYPCNLVQSGIKTGMMNTDTIQITPELLALLSEVDEFKGA